MSSGTNEQDGALRQALEWLVTDKMLADLKRHGNMKWCLKSLIFLGLFWAWGNGGVAGVDQREPPDQ